jgi:hypothetical protein
VPDYTMADFRAEMHRRKHGEQLGPKQQPTTSKLVTRPGLIGNRNGRRENRETFRLVLVRYGGSR